MYSSSLPSTSSEHKDVHSLIKLIERIRATGIYEQLESHLKPSWDEFQKKFLLSISMQKTYLELFRYYQGSQNLKARDILIAYSFIYYDMDKDESLCNAAKELIHCIHKEPLTDNYRSKLYQKIAKFERIYIPWKLDDRSKILEKLSHMYWEYEVNYKLYESRLSAEEKRYFLDEKKTKQDECLSIMKRIDNLSYFNQYQPVYVDSETSTLLIDILRRAFWNRIKEGLSKDEPDFEPLYSIFNEIRSHLHKIHQRRPQILQQYDEIIDIEFFKHRQRHNDLSIQFWFTRLSFLIDILVETDSSEKESNHRDFLDKISKDILASQDTVQQLELCINGLAYMLTRLLEIGDMYEHVFSSSL